MRTKFNGMLTLLLALMVQLALAQEKTVKGTVSDESGIPLPTASVVVKETNTGNYFYYDNYEPIKSVILTHYKAYQNKTLKSQPIGLQKYHRKALTESLSKLL